MIGYYFQRACYHLHCARYSLKRLYGLGVANWESMWTSDQNHIDYLDQVGPEKPVGFKCYKGKSLKKDWDTRKIENAMHSKGLKTKSFKFIGHLGGSVHALYVYHEEALQKLLEKNKQVLDRYGWSMDPEEFISNIQTIRAPAKTKLFDLIADAFADYDNWWRTDQDVPEEILEQALKDIKDNPDQYAQPII